MLYFPPAASGAAMNAVNARNAISQMNLYGYTTQSMLPSRRMEMEARGRFMATGSGGPQTLLMPPEMAAAYGTLPMPGHGGGGGRAARLRWSDREKTKNVKAVNDNARCEEVGGGDDDDEDVDENRNNYKGGRATRIKASAGG